jgi:arsenate reductase
MILYYNPRCSKCREAAGILEGQSCDFEIREYLKDPPTVKELREIVQKLGCKPQDLVRKSEPLYKEKYEGKKITGPGWLKILAENPILIERPIVITDEKAIIGRPPSLIVDFTRKKK